jgi:general secretion pathway protein C
LPKPFLLHTNVIDRLIDPDRLRAAVECSLVVLLAVQLARLAWLALIPPAPIGASAAAPGLPPQRGTYSGIDAFYPGSGTTVADTSGLRLFATRSAGSRQGSAIIADKDGRQRAFAVGDEIVPGTRLTRVAADHVLVESGGLSRRLDFAGTSGPNNSTAAIAGALPTAAPASSEPTSPVIDPQQLLAEAGLRPRSEGGRVTGYSVIARGDGATLRQAGLQSGDVLLTVNGQALTPERYQELQAELAGAQQITLTYQRGGETRTTTLQAKTP